MDIGQIEDLQRMTRLRSFDKWVFASWIFTVMVISTLLVNFRLSYELSQIIVGFRVVLSAGSKNGFTQR
jgi:hypothetical protein